MTRIVNIVYSIQGLYNTLVSTLYFFMERLMYFFRLLFQSSDPLCGNHIQYYSLNVATVVLAAILSGKKRTRDPE